MEDADLIIIGGGISGLGIARAAGHRGLRTVLIEANGCARQTSDNTLRIIHGGLRYLQTFDIKRMMESIRDQTALLSELPDVVKPLPCLMPLKRFGLKSRVPIATAASFYHIALRIGGSKLPPPFVLSGETAERKVPILDELAPDGALLWHDAHMLDPHAVKDAVIRDALQHNVTIIEDRRVTEVVKVGDHYDVVSEDGTRLRSRFVVNALGPWIGTITAPSSIPAFAPLWCKGFNIVISRQLDPTYAIGIEGRDGRLFFAVPRGSGTAIGTWYVPVNGPAFDLSVTKDEISTFLAAFNEALPAAHVEREEIHVVDAGVLPMVKNSPRGPVLYGREAFKRMEGYVEVLSTKYTTYRSQGENVVRELLAAART